MTCSKCGGQVGPSDPSCPHCGAPIDEVKKSEVSTGSRRGFELIVALVAALALAGVIFACSHFLPIYFKGLPSISPILYSKEATDLYISSDIHSSPTLISSKISSADPQVCTSDNGRFIAFVEEENGIKTLFYTSFNQDGSLDTKVVETDISDVTITQKGDNLYYRKEGYLYKYENGMNTKLYSAPVTSYKLSDTQSVVLFTCNAASGSGYEDLFLLDFAQSDIKVVPVDTDVTKVDTSLQTKRFAKIIYSKVTQEGTFDAYLYENGKPKLLAEKTKDYYVSATGDILFTKDAKSISLSRFVKDDMASADKSNPDDPAAARRNEIRAALNTDCGIPLVDVFFKSGDKQVTVCQNAGFIACTDMSSSKYIISIPSVLKDKPIPISEIDPAEYISSLKGLISQSGYSSVLYSGSSESAVLSTDEKNSVSKIIPSSDWKNFYKLSKSTGSDVSTLSILKDINSGEFTAIDSEVSQVIPNAGGGKFFYIREKNLFIYENGFSKILATDVISSSIDLENEGKTILFVERDTDNNNTGELISTKGDKRFTLGKDVSWFAYRNSQSVYFSIPTVGDRYDLYRSTDEGHWKLVDKDVLRTIK